MGISDGTTDNKTLQELLKSIKKLNTTTTWSNGIMIVLTVTMIFLMIASIGINRSLGRLVTPQIKVSIPRILPDDRLWLGITNTGPINVVTLSIDFKELVFSENNYIRRCITTSNAFYGLGKNWLTKDIIKPADIVIPDKFPTTLIPNGEYMEVKVFDVRYYRESDLKEYKTQKVFFIDKNREIYDCSDDVANNMKADFCENTMKVLRLFFKNDDWSLYELDPKSKQCIL